MAIEFSRDINFGQYLDLRSFVHRLDPRVKILAVGVLMTAVLLNRSFAGYAVLLAGLVIVHINTHIPISYTLRGMRLILNTVLIILLFQVLFFPAREGTVPIFEWGIVTISWDGIRQACLTFVRFVLLYYLMTTLLFTTTMMDLADGMEVMLEPLKRLRLPVNELVLSFVIAIKFVPLLVSELERMIKAQEARGARFSRGGLLTRARRLGGVLVPLFINAFNRAETLTTAMDARCYRGGRDRTKLRVLTFRRADAVAFALMLAVAVGTVVVGRLVVV